MTNDLNSNSRSGYRSKRKKTNLVLNGLIILVLLLIIFVAYNIFASGNDNASPKKATPKTEQKQTVKKEKKTEEVTKAKDDSSNNIKTDEEQKSEEATTSENADASQAVVSDGGSSPNVVKTIENPSWKPVGTTQSGEHTATYDTSSADWQEMLNAISYATGLDQSNMTIYWLGRDKSTTNGSFGVVSSKDKQQKFNVYIQWVDGEGWQPTRVEELSEIDR